MSDLTQGTENTNWVTATDTKVLTMARGQSLETSLRAQLNSVQF